MATKVFISYAKEDKSFVLKFYNDLCRAGLKPWLDSVDFRPGQLWRTAINKAIKDSSYFLAILSPHSVKKRGYVQKEIRYALNVAEEYPEDEVFIIPVRIEECEPSFEGLRTLHWVDLFPSYEKGLANLLRTLTYTLDEKPTLYKFESQKRVGVVAKTTDFGFGFIDSFPVIKTIFFHHNELRGVTFSELQEGDNIFFYMAVNERGMFAAVEIERV